MHFFQVISYVMTDELTMVQNWYSIWKLNMPILALGKILLFTYIISLYVFIIYSNIHA